MDGLKHMPVGVNTETPDNTWQIITQTKNRTITTLRFASNYELELTYYHDPDSSSQAKYRLVSNTRVCVLTGTAYECLNFTQARRWAVECVTQKLELLAANAHAVNHALTHSRGWAEALYNTDEESSEKG